MRLGFIGLGIMGTSMVHNLLRANYEVSVYNRTVAKLSAVLESGAARCISPTQLASRSEIILLSVTDGKAVKEVLFGEQGVIHGALPGTLVIDLSTISPTDTREISQRLADRHLSFLDAPVSGGDIGARNGTLTIMVGGLDEDFERAKPVLSRIGKTIVHVGATGAGQLTKCVNQLLVAGSVAAMTEGLVFAKAAGLDLQTTLDVVSQGAAGSWTLSNYAPRVLRGELGPGFYAKDMLKDLRIALAEADQHGSALPLSHLIKELYVALCHGDGANLGNHALIKLYQRLMPLND